MVTQPSIAGLPFPLAMVTLWGASRGHPRMVKKLMRLRACSMSGAPRAVFDTASCFDAPCLG